MDRKTVFYPVLGAQGIRIMPMDTRSAEARAFARRQAERLERMEHQKLPNGWTKYYGTTLQAVFGVMQMLAMRAQLIAQKKMVCACPAFLKIKDKTRVSFKMLSLWYVRKGVASSFFAYITYAWACCSLA